MPLPESIIPPKRDFFLWRNLPAPIKRRTSLMEELNEAVSRSIENVDGPVGVWASGGIDSSTLLLLLCKHLGWENVFAYYIDFGYRPDEISNIKKLSEILNFSLVIRRMTLNNHLELVEETVKNQRMPSDFSTQVLFASKLCKEDGIKVVYSGLGIDEILGGYPDHVFSSEEDYSQVEARLLWRAQAKYAYYTKCQAESQDLDIKFPFLDTDLIAYCRGLPRCVKTKDQKYTKITLREALKGLLPEKLRSAGYEVLTKGGFTPSLNTWWDEGLRQWSSSNIDKLSTSLKLKLLGFKRYARKVLCPKKVNKWIMIRLATVPIFLDHFID